MQGTHPGMCLAAQQVEVASAGRPEVRGLQARRKKQGDGVQLVTAGGSQYCLVVGCPQMWVHSWVQVRVHRQSQAQAKSQVQVQGQAQVQAAGEDRVVVAGLGRAVAAAGQDRAAVVAGLSGVAAVGLDRAGQGKAAGCCASSGAPIGPPALVQRWVLGY